MSFSVPANNQTDQVLVWAFSEDRPPSSHPDTDILKHSHAGAIRLSISSASSRHPYYHGEDEDVVSTKILLVANGVLASFGFLVLLPLGSLVARWGRTFSGKWLGYYRAVNMVVAMPAISLRVAMAFIVVYQHNERHFFEAHAVGVAGCIGDPFSKLNSFLYRSLVCYCTVCTLGRSCWVGTYIPTGC